MIVSVVLCRHLQATTLVPRPLSMLPKAKERRIWSGVRMTRWREFENVSLYVTASCTPQNSGSRNQGSPSHEQIRVLQSWPRLFQTPSDHQDFLGLGHGCKSVTGAWNIDGAQPGFPGLRPHTSLGLRRIFLVIFTFPLPFVPQAVSRQSNT